MDDVSTRNTSTESEILASVFFGELGFLDNDILPEYNYVRFVDQDGVFKSTGFYEAFANQGNDNQVFHFINEFALAVLMTEGEQNLARMGVWVQELRDFNSPNYDADLALGNLAVDFASNLITYYYSRGPVLLPNPYSALSNMVKYGAKKA